MQEEGLDTSELKSYYITLTNGWVVKIFRTGELEIDILAFGITWVSRGEWKCTLTLNQVCHYKCNLKNVKKILQIKLIN